MKIQLLSLLSIIAFGQKIDAMQNQRSPACMSYYGCDKHIVNQRTLKVDGIGNTIGGAATMGFGALAILPTAILGGMRAMDNFNQTSPRVSTEQTPKDLFFVFSIPLAFYGTTLCYTGYNYFRRGRKELNNANNYQAYVDEKHVKHCMFQPQNPQQ